VPICSPGISQPLPGIPAALVIDQAYVQSILPPAISWLFPYLPFASSLYIGDVATFCAADPPAIPSTPTAAQIAAFILGQPFSDYLLVDSWIRAAIQTYIWYKICGCTVVATPAPPTAPSAPANLPAINPPTVVTPAPGGACFSVTSTVMSLHAAGVSGTGITPPPFPPYVAGTGPFLIAPANVSYVDAVVTVTAAGATHDTYGGTIQFASSVNGPLLGTVGLLTSGFAAGTTRYNIQPSHTSAFTGSFWNLEPMFDETNARVGTDLIQVTIEMYCGNNRPGAPAAACCPPDPQLMGLIHQLIDGVTLIQRQAVPFGYIPGTVHSGLTGSGVLSVSDLIGAKVDCTTIPASLGIAGTSPAEHFNLGYITWGTADGYPQSVRIEHQPLLSLPSRAGAFTDLAYDLHPGVVATITELKREA
jgi:hypothetical protein